MKKARIIYNPSSGEGMIAAALDAIISLYQEHGMMLTPYRLDFKREPQELLSGLDGETDHILIAGGDGTVNHVVNVLMKAGVEIPVGILPAGTANDFAGAMGMHGTDIIKNCKQILHGTPHPVDLGRVNGEYFVNIFSCGLFTDISQKTPSFVKNTFGKLAYYMNGIGELTRFRKMKIRVSTDSGDYDGESIIFFVFNGRTAGRFNLAYKSVQDDGLLDVLILKGDNPFGTLATALRYFTIPGRRKRYPRGVLHMQCREITVQCDTDESTDIDGQPGPGFPIHIECVPHAIKILVPTR